MNVNLELINVYKIFIKYNISINLVYISLIFIVIKINFY
jgi:hypothetical protein